MQKDTKDRLDLFEQDDLGRKVVNDVDRYMLRSILTKDNDRIKEEMRDAKVDVVFNLAYAGGGFAIKRFTCTNGKQYFVTSGSNMTMDENDDEKWVPWEDAPTASFEGSLAELRMGTSFLCLRPSLVHPDYRNMVRDYVEQLLTKVTYEERKSMSDLLPASADDWLARLR